MFTRASVTTVAVVPGRRRLSVQLHVGERCQFVENGADAAIVAGEQLVDVGRRTEYERRLVECVDEVVAVERSPASPTDARSLIWNCCRRARVDGHDDERVVRQRWRLNIDRQGDAVVARHEHVQLVIMSVSGHNIHGPKRVWGGCCVVPLSVGRAGSSSLSP